MSNIGTPGRGLSSFVNFDISREMPVEPFKGLVLTSSTVNPGTELGQPTKTLWLNSADGHAYRGTVDLEAMTDISALEAAVGDLETRSTTVEGDVTTIQTDITTLEGDVSGLQFALLALESSASGNFSTTPAEFGPIAYSLYKIGKMVTLNIGWRVMTLSADVATITVSGGIPVGFRPRFTTRYPALFFTINLWDTGLIGAITIYSSGDIVFARDLDASPALFSGNTGWSESLTFTYETL